MAGERRGRSGGSRQALDLAWPLGVGRLVPAGRSRAVAAVAVASAGRHGARARPRGNRAAATPAQRRRLDAARGRARRLRLHRQRRAGHTTVQAGHRPGQQHRADRRQLARRAQRQRWRFGGRQRDAAGEREPRRYGRHRDERGLTWRDRRDRLSAHRTALRRIDSICVGREQPLSVDRIGKPGGDRDPDRPAAVRDGLCDRLSVRVADG